MIKRGQMLIIAAAVAAAGQASAERATTVDGYAGGHGYVDFGLPSGTLWSVLDLGSTDEYEPGEYYAWGEVSPKSEYVLLNYEHLSGISGTDYEITDIGDSISGTEYDAAAEAWGDGWRMPTCAEITELWSHTYGRRTEEGGRTGVRVLGKGGKSMFLCDSGYKGAAGIRDSTITFYWAGSLYDYGEDSGDYADRREKMAMTLTIEGGVEDFWPGEAYKELGCCIRPVISRKRAGVTGVAGPGGIMMACSGGTMRISAAEPIYRITVTDISGKVHYDKAFGGERSVSFDAGFLGRGIYIVRATVNGAAVAAGKIAI